MTTINLTVDLLSSTVAQEAGDTAGTRQSVSLSETLGIPDEGYEGMLEARPQAVGRHGETEPMIWFQWGDLLVADPLPTGPRHLKAHLAQMPVTGMSQDHFTPFYLPKEFWESIIDFGLYATCLKLKKWKQAAMYYNIYIRNLKKRRKEYIQRKAEERAIHRMPDNVKGGREQPEKRDLHRIPDNVKYKGGQPWAH